METKESIKSAEVISSFETCCPRCPEKAVVKRTATHFLTQCSHCGFDMGQPRDPEFIVEGGEQ